MSSIVLIAANRVSPEERGVRTVKSENWMEPTVEWAASGLRVTARSWKDQFGVIHPFDEVEHEAEVAPVRPYSFADLRKGIVATIGSKKYRITVCINHMDEDDSWGDCGIPETAVVTFDETTDPETPWTPFDEEAAKAQNIKLLRESIETVKENLPDRVEHYAKQIAQIESGEWKMRPRGDVHLFGKPYFIQNPIFPALDGVAARCLMVLETEWGDSGNINLLFATDTDGRPCKVWMEASCC